jgi:hypothetical protein
MSQNFKLRSDDLDENDDDNLRSEDSTENFALHKSGGHGRNISFAQLDGRRKFLNYAYLVSGEYSPENGSLSLEFTSETVTLDGVRLNSLYNDLFYQRISEIRCVDMRYYSTEDQTLPIVTKIVTNSK